MFLFIKNKKIQQAAFLLILNVEVNYITALLNLLCRTICPVQVNDVWGMYSMFNLPKHCYEADD